MSYKCYNILGHFALRSGQGPSSSTPNTAGHRREADCACTNLYTYRQPNQCAQGEIREEAPGHSLNHVHVLELHMYAVQRGYGAIAGPVATFQYIEHSFSSSTSHTGNLDGIEGIEDDAGCRRMR